MLFPPSLPHFLGKYQFHTLVFPVQCCVDRCLEVGCGSVAMVTSLLLRRLLPSSVATFKAPTLQYSIGLEFKKEFLMTSMVALPKNQVSTAKWLFSGVPSNFQQPFLHKLPWYPTIHHIQCKWACSSKWCLDILILGAPSWHNYLIDCFGLQCASMAVFDVALIGVSG